MLCLWAALFLCDLLAPCSLGWASGSRCICVPASSCCGSGICCCSNGALPAPGKFLIGEKPGGYLLRQVQIQEPESIWRIPEKVACATNSQAFNQSGLDEEHSHARERPFSERVKLALQSRKQTVQSEVEHNRSDPIESKTVRSSDWSQSKQTDLSQLQQQQPFKWSQLQFQVEACRSYWIKARSVL